MIDDLFEAAPIGLGILDADLRWVRVNAAMAGLNRAERATIVGRRPSELQGAVGEVVEAVAREVAAGGPAVSRPVAGELLTAPGVERHWNMAWFPVADGVGIAAVEITARVHAERELAAIHRRDALLARAGQLLSTALDVKGTADLVVQLLVPDVADAAIVTLAGERGGERIAWAHRDPARVGLVGELERRHPFADAASAGPPRLVRRDGIASCAVPLVARGRVLGALLLAADDAGDPGAAETVELARALADRAALALDNAALYAQRDRVAVTLQEQLLPPRLPAIPGLEIAARYSAAGDGNQVGGDFYDVFRSGDGWQLVIGDVVGKGPAAAAITGLARHTIRAAAAYEGAPSQLLRVLNDALLAEHSGRRLASVACVRLDPEGDGVRLTASVAGHPLPLVVRPDGAVREVGRFGQLLGVDEDLVVFNSTDHLAPHELLVVYTDGVIEARGSQGWFGEEQLQALLATMGGEAPTRVLQRVESAVLAASDERPRDDMAMVGLRVRPGL